MTRSRSVGLAILGLLSVLDVLTPLFTDGDHPPMAVALVGSVIGLASLVLIWHVARGARRAVMPLVLLRVLSAFAALPGLIVDDVPVAIRGLVAVWVALTIVGVVLVARPASRIAEAVTVR